MNAGLLTREGVVKLIAMSIKAKDTFVRQPSVLPQELAYPAEFHFRIIVEAAVSAEDALRKVLSAYKVTAPLAVSKASSAGRYQAYCVSVEIQSHAELSTFDTAVKSVPGVRMLL